MAHEIMVNDNMFSVREKPWHGLGDILAESPTVDEARKQYLTWTASTQPLFASVEIDTGDGAVVKKYMPVPNKHGVIREDTKDVIGVVGNRYKIYQNSDMWNFIEDFSKAASIQLETAGSLRNGETTWVLAKGSNFEVITGDPIDQYFLFKNAFNGGAPISVLFTNIRVVCNNTLTAALDRAKNVYNVRHTSNLERHMGQIASALGVQKKYQTAIQEALTTLSSKQITETKMRELLTEELFPEDSKNIQDIGEEDNVSSIVLPFKQSKERAKKMQEIRNNMIIHLVENGAGTDIPGVRGTAYGFYQALVEWNDHVKSLRTSNRAVTEAKFENAFFSAQEFKNRSLKILLAA